MEDVLGLINNKRSKARAIVLRNNGIKSRYYAFKDGKSTHTNAQMCAEAIRDLFNNGRSIEDLQIITAGSTTTDQLLPSHSAMIHGELGIQNVELISTNGACCSSIQAMKYAYMAVASGMATTAASVGSEKVSTWMHASRFEGEMENTSKLEENPYIAFEKDFLRWMLSDGAGAALITDKPNESELSLKIEWLETTSYANELETCMYAGAIKNEDASLTGWNEMSTEEWINKSVFSLKQDTKLLAANIVPKGGAYLKKLAEKHDLTADKIDYFLPHMSSEFFKQAIHDILIDINIPLPYDKWFYNLPKVGNVGAASAFIMLEELFKSGKLKKGEKILVMVPESARFSYAYMYLTVV